MCVHFYLRWLPFYFSYLSCAVLQINLKRFATKIRSPLIFAHVRAAYPGMLVSEANCHPFQFGRFLWMHNGGIGKYTSVARTLRESLRDELYNAMQVPT
jgi:predicted glutamine amidotransferase